MLSLSVLSLTTSIIVICVRNLLTNLVLEEIKAGQKLSALSKRENLPKSTVSTRIKLKERIRSLCDQNSSRLRDRSTSHDDLDGVFLTWFRQLRSEGVPIDGPILLEKTNKFLRTIITV